MPRSASGRRTARAWSRVARRTGACLLLQGALGCHLISEFGDFTFGDAPPPPDEPPVECSEPSPGAEIAEDTTWCAGSYAFPAVPGVAAARIVAPGVKLLCLETVLDGGGDPPAAGRTIETERSIGIAIEADDVTIQGCAVRGYGYGIAAVDVNNPTLTEIIADDNYHAPEMGWTEDLRGGGILLEHVTGGTVEGSSFARNWNGIELRATREVKVLDNVADHASNTGALLLDAHDNVLSGNDFSWAVRGVSYPDAWYGHSTSDSAGILLEQGSSGNELLDNEATYGGNGIFLRGLDGPCPQHNVVAGNDVSFSPNNGIECWCDHNRFEGNHSEESNYGLWTGGADHAVIRGNTIIRSRIDGISIQRGESRHVLIEDNAVSESGRVGILITGREFQANSLTDKLEPLYNASHYVVQRNDLYQNTTYDLFAASAQSLALISNCAASSGNYYHFQYEVDVHKVHGFCTDAVDHLAPSAALAEVEHVPVGSTVVLDASGSLPSRPGDSLAYTWLVQPAGHLFWTGDMPERVYGGDGPALLTIQPPPGVFDVDVTVDDGRLAGMAQRSFAVIPAGQRIGESASEWDYACAPCTTTFTDVPGGVEGEQVHVITDAAYLFTARAPASRDLGFDASQSTHLGFFLRAKNDNLNWQVLGPVVVVASASGSLTYTPEATALPRSPDELIYVEVPLAGGGGWTRVESGTPGPVIDWVELQMDTYEAGFELWIDALTIY